MRFSKSAHRLIGGIEVSSNWQLTVEVAAKRRKFGEQPAGSQLRLKRSGD
jgi:hypothetical protein